jgi:hypothetical protein
MIRAVVLTLGILTISSAAAAQSSLSGRPVPTQCESLLDSIATAADPATRSNAATTLVNMNLHPSCLAETLLLGASQRQAFAEFLERLESRRTDKQAGTSTGTGGTTSLVSKGTTAKVLSIAAEYGALTESVNKQIVTVQGSLDGIPAALVRNQVVEYCPTRAAVPGCIHRDAIEWLRRFSYSVSFDTTQGVPSAIGAPSGTPQGAAQPVTFDVTGRAVVDVTARTVLWNARDTTSKTFLTQWTKAQTRNADDAKKAGAAPAGGSQIDKAANDLLAAMRGLLNEVMSDPAYRSWQEETIAALRSVAGPDEVRAAWSDRQRALYATLQPKHQNITEQADIFARALGRYIFEEDDAVRAVARKPVLTLQYDHRTPNGKPPTTSLRVIFDKGLAHQWSVAANGAIETYDAAPSAEIPGAGRVRDVQLGIQLQRDLGTLALLGAAAVSGTYYFQYQNSPAILDVTPGSPFDGITFVGLATTAKQVFAEKGHLHLAQIRLMLGQGSARVPISVSYSNRTELIDTPAWRAQIGVSYDFDSLFGK